MFLIWKIWVQKFRLIKLKWYRYTISYIDYFMVKQYMKFVSYWTKLQLVVLKPITWHGGPHIEPPGSELCCIGYPQTMVRAKVWSNNKNVGRSTANNTNFFIYFTLPNLTKCPIWFVIKLKKKEKEPHGKNK